MNSMKMPVAVVIGATSKWQADGRNTHLAHGKALDDQYMPVGMRWGIGGAVAQKFASEGYFVVLTTRTRQQRSRPRKRHKGPGWRLHDRGIGPGIGYIHIDRIRDHPERGRLIQASSSTTRVISKVVIYHRRKNCSNISR